MQHVLIVRLGALGDLVHALPALAAVHDAHPGARVTWLVDARYRELLELVPSAHSIVTVDTRRWRGSTGVPRVLRALRGVRFDVALDFQGLLKSAVLARLSGARVVAGFGRATLREPLARFFYTQAVPVRARGHVIAKNLDLVKGAGAAAADGQWRFPIAETTPSPDVARFIDETRGAPLALVNPGGGWPNKRWPADRFGALCRRLRDEHGMLSAVLWGPGDRELASHVVESSQGAARLAPQTTIADLIALGRSGALMVSGDTGPLHLAAAVGTPIVGIYGPTDPARNGPWSPEDAAISRSPVCECHHLRRCRAARWCLDDVTVEEVAQAVRGRLARTERA